MSLSLNMCLLRVPLSQLRSFPSPTTLGCQAPALSLAQSACALFSLQHNKVGKGRGELYFVLHSWAGIERQTGFALLGFAADPCLPSPA